MNDFLKAIKYTWIIISILLLIGLILIFLLPENIILKNSPQCISMKYYKTECSLCGSTRAFICISHLKFNEAFKLNRSSIFLFRIFFLNSLIFFSWICKSTIKIITN